MSQPARTLTWHLREWMAYRGIDSYAEFGRRIAAQGHQVSSAHVARLMLMPELLSIPMLDAICRVLDCTPGDLIRTSDQPAPITKPHAPTSLELPKPHPPRLPETARRQVVGPPMRAMQAHALAQPKPEKERD